MIESGYNIILDKLNEFIRKYYKNELLKGTIYAFGLTLLFFISFTYLEYFAHLEIAARTTLFYSFVLLSLFVTIRYIIVPLLKLYQLGNTLSYEQAAKIIGKHFTDVQDKLLNILQLHFQVNNAAQQSQQNDLIYAGINQKIKELKPIPFTAAVNLKDNFKYLKYALIPFFIIVFTLLAAPHIIKDGTKRLVQYNQYFEKEAPFKFIILNKNLSTVVQQDYLLEVKLEGNEVPENIYISIGENEFKLNKESNIKFNYLFKNIQSTVVFNLVADDFKSKEYELKAFPNPVLLSFDVELRFPEYLNRKTEIVKNTGDLSIPAGTRVAWKFKTQHTNSVSLNFEDTTINLSDPANQLFEFKSRYLKSQTYSIATSNQYFKNKDAIHYLIDVVLDEYPQINLEEKADSISIKEIYFAGEIKDDYGFKKLAFNYRLTPENDETVSEEYKKITTNVVPIDINKLSVQETFYYYWNLNNTEVNPGDNIEYYFEVWDNDGVSGSKLTRSQKKVFKMPSVKELEEKSQKNNEEIKDDLEKAVSQTKNIQKEISDLQRKLTEKKSLTWEEKKKLENLLEKQKELQQKIEHVKNENKANNQQQSEYKNIDESIAEKQKQLEELFEKVMTPELKEKMDELEKLLEQMDKNKIQEALDKMKFDNKDLLKELDRNLEIFKQLEVEQKLQESIDKLDKLTEKQNELSKKSEDKKADTEQLKNEQDKLNEEFKSLKNELNDLQKKNNELEQPKDIKNTDDQQQDIQQEMQKSSNELDKKDKKGAAQSQKSAAQKMQKMKEQMQDMQAQMEQEQQTEDMDDLRKILQNLLQLSFGQESLMNELSKSKPGDPQYFKITQQQNKLLDDAKMIEDSLYALSKRVPQLEATVNKEISAINMNMEKAVKHMVEAPTFSFEGINHRMEAKSRQQFAMTSVNNLALMLNEILGQMQEQSKQQQSKPGNGSCKKPGGKGEKPSPATLRKMQEQLNEQIKKLKEGMGKEGGNKPGMSKELAKLAAEQEAIRKELKKLSDQIDKDGNGGGDLKKLAEEMEKTESDLVNKVINQETIKRQEEILTRLLESEKADKEREEDQKRQSKESKNENFSNPNQFLEYKGAKKNEEELLKTVPPSMTPFFKNKVARYFEGFKD
jgi:hypothetical protein